MGYNFRTSIKPSQLAKEAAMESSFLTAVNRNGDAEPPSTPPKKVFKATLAVRKHREALEAKKNAAEVAKEALNTNNDKEGLVRELIKQNELLLQQNKLLSEQNSELRSSKDVVVG